jgi:hypothetical protein
MGVLFKWYNARVHFKEDFLIIISLIFSSIVSVGSFAWGFFQADFETLTRWMIAFGLFWMVAQWQKWRWVSSVWVVCAVLIAIVSLWFDVIFGWMFSGALFALFAWDLTEFWERIKLLPPREDAKGMTRRHLIRIGMLAVSGLLIAFVFGWF